MSRPGQQGRDAAVAALAVAVVVTVSPLRALWLGRQAPWWGPFAMWTLLIAIGVLLARHGREAS